MIFYPEECFHATSISLAVSPALGSLQPEQLLSGNAPCLLINKLLGDLVGFNGD